ncbi:MAG: FkbM family methyltransferase [Chthoniobacter sp.]|nr:FkbM family methyltransferase [Chthoniobacter sp.]
MTPRFTNFPTLRRAYETLIPLPVRIRLHNRLFTRHAARWEKIRDSPQSLITDVSPGVKMKLYGDSQLCEMLHFGNFEAETQGFFDAFLRPGDTFLDIGANVGFFTLAAARRVGPGGHVHAFEPCSKTFDRLLENVRLNGLRNVTCHRLALSHEDAQAQLNMVNGGFDAWNSLGTPYMGETAGSETVTTVRLDTFARQHGLVAGRCVVKIDVEGWESQVLLGGREFLSSADGPVMCVEFTEEAAQLAGSSCRALYQALEKLGFGIFSVGPCAAEIQPYPLPEPFPNLNLLAAKDLAAIRARLAEVQPC